MGAAAHSGLPSLVGGKPVVRLTAPPAEDAARAAFLSAEFAPGRGAMLLQARIRLPGLGETDLLASPPPERWPSVLGGGPDDFAGNAAFGIGGALLIPFANRIRGAAGPDRTLRTQVLGKPVTLPRNWGGKREGAEEYAMHGLLLDQAADRYNVTADSLTAVFDAGDFDGRWLSSLHLTVTWKLKAEALSLSVEAVNRGEEDLPVGIGWHPWFALPSGRRDQARLRLPARSRLAVNDYDEVLPTGEILPTAGTAYDFAAPGGRPLGGLYIDDCFTDLDRTPFGKAVVEVTDPAAGHGVRISTPSPAVTAIQVYAPPDHPVVVVEPQFNWADPYGAAWNDPRGQGMCILSPGASVSYDAKVELFRT